ncbi:MAG: hypothetical protein HVK41_06040 [Pelagibacteraceae bacterium]|jgi:hypothetical protein|nr:hypothetical protein [Pelagibacteraceae bacterium]MBO6470562.1 hypothetical protein [Pelagibacteraceae bacterium]MBO6470922.1 hypothetical protein [Pelagibacteraceae bacterium]|tara:strand:- start:1133 stop:2218 length:1086 start_codon:yes stop_codon:yes gene_type:complete
MKLNLIKSLIILIIISISVKAEEVEKILFSINDDIYTTVDLYNRIKYLKIISINNANLTYENYLKDFISVILYNEQAKEYNIIINEKTLNDFYNSLLINYKKEKSNIYISEEELLKNVRYDYQRKTIIENLLNEKKDSILKEEDNILDIYNIKLDYFTFNKDINENLDKIIELIDFNEIDLSKKNLKQKSIDYFYFSKVINSFNNIDDILKKEIINNKKIIIIKRNNYILIGKTIREFKNNINLNITFFKISSNKEINNELIYCENIDNIKTEKSISVEKFDRIEISKLSNFIKKNLISINDKIQINEDNSKYYLILCEFNYNSKNSKEVIINNKINDELLKIKNNFLFEQKIKYKFKLYE